ncbi:hypothetical protein BES34_018485 [Leptospira inadai serovar Lyme]|uniref:Transposase DDE domain protein n=1 Tax=Leptospira inadai serovar Lyme TaxID=293084 RepID=A0ABX4YE63_9LEPT|nr:hypothetical protein BES34_018485 [Leptospira inadai serovar Lyme]
MYTDYQSCPRSVNKNTPQGRDRLDPTLKINKAFIILEIVVRLKEDLQIRRSLHIPSFISSVFLELCNASGMENGS